MRDKHYLMMSVKLKSSDNKTVLVDQKVIEQLVTIQTLMDCPLVDHSNDEPIPIYDLCHQLNFDIKTPRHGYDQCIVTVQDMEDGRCLKYLDRKVWL